MNAAIAKAKKTTRGFPKKELRVIGFDDSPFDKFDPNQSPVLVVGSVFRGGEFMDGLLSCYVDKDGEDATLKLINLVNSCKFKLQLQAIFLDGIAFAGFNVVNIFSLNRMTGIPVVVVVRDNPDMDKIFSALEKLGMKKKVELLKKFPKPVNVNGVYVQSIGMSIDDTKKLLKVCCTRANIPEALRFSHLVASGIVEGESRGRA
ncbi:MAG: DUF99 family protein [archaeon]